MIKGHVTVVTHKCMLCKGKDKFSSRTKELMNRHLIRKHFGELVDRSEKTVWVRK